MAGYVRGLLAELVRKNGWSLAEAAGDTGPEGMQRLLNSYSWDTDGLRDDVRQVAIGDRQAGVLIVDETGFGEEGNPLGRGRPTVLKGLRGGSRTARSGCSWPTPAGVGGR